EAQGKFVVCGTANGDVFVLDCDNKGAPKWTWHTGASITTRPIIQGNNVIFASLDDWLYVFDAQSGKEVAKYDAREAICSGPLPLGYTIAGMAPMNEKLAVTSTTGWVSSYDLKTGQLAWTHELKTEATPSAPARNVTIAAAPIFHNDELYVLTFEGEVVVFPS